ncbi:hypothetical protein [Saccharospirillum salsuginis]|uniref:Uncharacterized protein n=1 Tax=Saccharospirillum salsuginis TaxID=418750 RepID=A0A918N6Z1_9GAMM|nr:hypothetical protein [Saccharospirillum salsuginis]GGX41049.1 hypothetical protein GCM10007392_04830 [Saccharospirillum salsuginis]
MSGYLEEIDYNFDIFFDKLLIDINDSMKESEKSKEVFSESFKRIISIQAWRTEIVEQNSPDGACQFFKEAQNDALISHSLARQGAWRPSLMSLRSCIENTLLTLYYIDHPVEFNQWSKGKHRLGFSDLVKYLAAHPNFEGTKETENGLSELKREYETLSKAVHGSTKSFRMTKGGTISGLNSFTEQELGAWNTRERITICALNLILLFFFRNLLQGAAKRNLRKSIGLTTNTKKSENIKSLTGVKIPSQH